MDSAQLPFPSSTGTEQSFAQKSPPSQKRKRDSDDGFHSSAQKAARHTPASTAHPQQNASLARISQYQSHLQVNYLAPTSNPPLPLVSPHDAMPAALQLLNSYHDVLERSESLAGSLGAKPLRAVLLEGLDRMFDSPPQILEAPTASTDVAHNGITWLDVALFADARPEDFVLTESSADTARFCEFWTKGCRVRISENDWTLVRSGAPRKLVPPQPFGEDEVRELGACEILEGVVGGVVRAADQGWSIFVCDIRPANISDCLGRIVGRSPGCGTSIVLVFF